MKMTKEVINRGRIRKYVQFEVERINQIMTETLKILQILDSKGIVSLKNKFRNLEFVQYQIKNYYSVVKNV